MPPFNLLGWVGMGVPVGVAESWWYSLPEASRSSTLYTVVTSIGYVLYPLTVALGYWVLYPRAEHPESFFRPRRMAVAGAFVAASALWHVTQMSNGLEFQGAGWFAAVVVFNLIVVAVLVALWVRGTRSRSWPTAFATHVILFLWVTSLAFPWLGEML